MTSLTKLDLCKNKLTGNHYCFQYFIHELIVKIIIKIIMFNFLFSRNYCEICEFFHGFHAFILQLGIIPSEIGNLTVLNFLGFDSNQLMGNCCLKVNYSNKSFPFPTWRIRTILMNKLSFKLFKYSSSSLSLFNQQ